MDVKPVMVVIEVGRMLRITRWKNGIAALLLGGSLLTAGCGQLPSPAALITPPDQVSRQQSPSFNYEELERKLLGGDDTPPRGEVTGAHPARLAFPVYQPFRHRDQFSFAIPDLHAVKAGLRG